MHCGNPVNGEFDLSDSFTAVDDHYEILGKGVKKWNEWRAANPGVRPNLKRKNLDNLNLSGYNFQHANLSWVTFRNSDCSHCDFRCARLSDADFTNANLTSADFTDANLCDAVFIGANLENTILQSSLMNRGTLFPGNNSTEE